MASTSSTEAALRIKALEDEVTRLRAELVRSRGVVSSLTSASEFFRRSFQGFDMGVGLIAPDTGRSIYVSVSVERIFGFSHDDCEADSTVWMRSIDPRDRPLVESAIRDAFGGTQAEHTYRIRRGGLPRYVRSRFSRVDDSDGSSYVMATFEDVTDRKSAEQALHDNEAKYRRIVETACEGIVLTDADWRVTFVNARMAEIIKMSPAEMLGKHVLEIIIPDEHLRARQLIARREQGIKETYRAEARLRDGTDLFLTLASNPVFDELGNFVGSLTMVSDITEQARAEEALRESEERFRMLSNCSPVGIFLSDASGKIVYTNPRLHAICGFEAGELAATGFTRAFHPDDRTQGLANWLKIASSPGPHDVERRFVHRDGTIRRVHVRSAPLVSSSGAVAGRVGTVEDITDRKLAQEQMRRSEERYRLLAEHSTDLISKHEADGVYLYASPACRTLLGYEPEELVGHCAYDLFHPEDLAAIRESSASFSDPLRIPTVAYRIRRKDGQYIWFETTTQSIPDPGGGAAQCIVAVSRDVTVRRHAAERLRASEARMRGILNTAGDGIVTFDEEGLIELFNPGAERLFGYAADEVLGQDVRTLMPADWGADGNTPRRRSPLGGSLARTQEIVGYRKNGSTCELEIRLGETVIAGRSVFTGFLHDVSEHKRTERMLRESEKLAATGRIAARVAHEINNPLAGIKNSFLLIKDAVGPEHPYFDYVARIENEVDRIARIVRQMFDLYRPGQVTPREIELVGTIHDVVALLDVIARAREVALDVDTTGIVGPVRLPEDSVRQVLYNVIVNALEASPVGGHVNITAKSGGRNVEIFVADQGQGIPAPLHAHIYEPFFTTKSQSGTGGLGLGLPISRGIVEALQGTLDFRSTPERGTVFRIRIPTLDQESESGHD